MTSSPRTLHRVLVGGALAAILTLTACGGNQGASESGSPSPNPSSASGSPSATPTSTVSPSPDLSAIKVDNAATPTVTFTAPWGIAETQTKVITEGKSGQKVGSDARVTINYAGYNGTTGKVFDSSFTKGTPATFSLSQVIAGFKKGLEGQTVGSRVLIGITSADGYPQGRSDGSIAAGDSLIFVVDIISSSFDEARGEAVAPKDGLPTVTMKDGKPEISIASGSTAPADLVVQPLIKGSGAAVAADSTISVKYRSWTYGDGKLVKDAWQAQSGSLSALIPGWKEGLVGQTAGSRVLLIVPPSKAYPDGQPSATPALGANETLVYVIDILDVQAASGT